MKIQVITDSANAIQDRVNKEIADFQAENPTWVIRTVTPASCSMNYMVWVTTTIVWENDVAN